LGLGYGLRKGYTIHTLVSSRHEASSGKLIIQDALLWSHARAIAGDLAGPRGSSNFNATCASAIEGGNEKSRSVSTERKDYKEI
jgi:hypothetical protein